MSQESNGCKAAPFFPLVFRGLCRFCPRQLLDGYGWCNTCLMRDRHEWWLMCNSQKRLLMCDRHKWWLMCDRQMVYHHGHVRHRHPMSRDPITVVIPMTMAVLSLRLLWFGTLLCSFMMDPSGESEYSTVTWFGERTTADEQQEQGHEHDEGESY